MLANLAPAVDGTYAETLPKSAIKHQAARSARRSRLEAALRSASAGPVFEWSRWVTRRRRCWHYARRAIGCRSRRPSSGVSELPNIGRPQTAKRAHSSTESWAHFGHKPGQNRANRGHTQKDETPAQRPFLATDLGSLDALLKGRSDVRIISGAPSDKIRSRRPDLDSFQR